MQNMIHSEKNAVVSMIDYLFFSGGLCFSPFIHIIGTLFPKHYSPSGAMLYLKMHFFM